MWIEELDIDGFRRLAGRFELRPGLNVVLGGNEAGKSTLHEALVRALFGFSRAERRGEAAWRRSRPWDRGRPYRLRALVREARDGCSYRIEWDFDSHAVRLLDAVTGVDRSAEVVGKGRDVSLGEYLLGIDYDNFRGVCCLDQRDVTPVRRSDWLTASLQRAVASAAGEGAGRDQADSLLAGYLSALGFHALYYTPIPTGRARALQEEQDRLRWELAEEEERRRRVEQLAAERDDLSARAAKLRGQALAGELDAARRRLEEARRLQRQAGDRPAFLPDLDVAEVDRLQAQLDHVAGEVERWQGEADARRSEVASLQGRREELIRRRQALASYAEVDTSAEAAVREAWAALQTRSADEPTPAAREGGGRAWRLLCLLTLGLARLLGRAWRALLRWIARRARASAAARRRAELEGRLAATLDRAGAAEGPDPAARAAAYLAACERRREWAEVGGELDRVEGALAVAKEPERALQRARQTQAQLAQELDALCAACGIGAGEVEQVRADRARAQRAEEAERVLRALLGADTMDDVEGRVAELDRKLAEHERAHGPCGEGAADLEETRRKLRTLEDRLARLEGEMAAVERGLRAPAEVKEALEEVEERLSLLELHRDAVRLARETLAEAARETHRAFAPRLNEALGRSLPRITAGRYREALVSDDLAVKVRAPETGTFVEPSQLSRATQDGIFLVQRLAIARLLDPTLGAAPLLLDDPFARFDRRRLRLGVDLLADMAEDRQVILFTDDPALEELAAEICPGLHRIELPPVG